METIEYNPEEENKKKRTKYFAEFAAAHTSAFRPAYKEGQTLGQGPEVWRNVSEHGLAAGAIADILAEEFELDEKTRKDLVDAVIMHDWYKKHEIQAMDKARKEGELNLAKLDEIKEKDTQILREMGIPEHIIELAGSNVPKDEKGPETIEQKIAWYIDAMLTGTDPVKVSGRYQDLLRGWDGKKVDPIKAERNKKFSDIYREKYNGRTLFEVQEEIGGRVEHEFAERMGYEGDPRNLPFVLRDKLEQKILSSV